MIVLKKYCSFVKSVTNGFRYSNDRIKKLDKVHLFIYSVAQSGM